MTRALYRHADLHRLLDPATIAVVGASPRAGSFGQRVLENLRDFRGTVYLVNARHERIGDHACSPSLAALPAVPDCVIVAAPREEIESIVEECGRLGVGGMVVFASGFAEMGTADRIAEQARLVNKARRLGVRLAGPNCIGIVNWRTGAVGTFIGPLRPRPSNAPAVGLVSQSGALGFALAQAVEHGAVFSHVLTCGNSADVDVADYIAYLAEDLGCAAIACVFEGMNDPLRLIEAATIARAAGKAVVVFKIATGEQGAAAAMSHTGSLAGANDAYAAAFEKAGIVVVEQFEALVETAAFFAKSGRCQQPGVAVVSTSGGAAIMAADKAEQHGLSLPQPALETTAVLLSRIPDFGSARNPCDITAQAVTDPESFAACTGALLSDPAYGALVVPFVFSYDIATPRIALLNKLAHQHDKAMCIVWLPQWLEGPGSLAAEQADRVAMFRSMEACFSTLAKWQTWSALAPVTPVVVHVPTPVETRANAQRVIAASQGPVISERAAKSLLASYGVSMVSDRLVTTLEACIDAASTCGYPVVVKVDSAKIPHKTEAGVVRLNIIDEMALRVAYAEVMANALQVAASQDINGVLVQPMIGQGLEVIIGARIDALFGPMVVVGLGGILVELLRDSAVAFAPLGKDEAMGLLRRLKGFQLLNGFRGSAAVDLAALAWVICRVGDFASDHRDFITELDINPLICTPTRIIGVDALIALRPPAQAS
jgi:acyl-CoA synthetase (NDP forming)